MNNFDLQYQALLKQVLEEGTDCSSRGLSYRQLFGSTLRHDMREGFPLTSLRKLGINPIIDYFLWSISGSFNVNDAGASKNHWNYLADSEGYISTTYGRMWRSWPQNKPNTINPSENYRKGDFDQLSQIIEDLCYNATSRAIVLQTYNPAVKNQQCKPCHVSMVFSSDGQHLDVLVTKRSWDLIIGFCSDMPMFALLQTALAQYAQLEPRHLQVTSANSHIYLNNNHMGIAQELISRTPLSLSKLIIADSHPFRLTNQNIQIEDYQSHDRLKPDF